MFVNYDCAHRSHRKAHFLCDLVAHQVVSRSSMVNWAFLGLNTNGSRLETTADKSTAGNMYRRVSSMANDMIVVSCLMFPTRVGTRGSNSRALAFRKDFCMPPYTVNFTQTITATYIIPS